MHHIPTESPVFIEKSKFQASVSDRLPVRRCGRGPYTLTSGELISPPQLIHGPTRGLHIPFQYLLSSDRTKPGGHNRHFLPCTGLLIQHTVGLS